MARTDANHLWSANSNSEVLYTTNGGKLWNRSIIQLQLDCETCSNAADIAFLDNSQGWAVINGLFTTTSWVWHSVDGGQTWQSLNVTNTGALSGLAIIDGQTLVAVSGLIDAIYRSTDAGVTWVAVRLLTTLTLAALWLAQPASASAQPDYVAAAPVTARL